MGQLEVNFIMIAVGLMLIFALTVIFFLNKTQNRIQQTKIKAQQMELQYSVDLLDSIVKTQEDERQRISRELHDDVTSQLNIINLYVNLLKENTSKNDDDAELLEKIALSLKSSIERTRNMSYELIPVFLKKFGIQYALKDLVDNINNTGKVKVNLQGDDLIAMEDEYKLLHIYRIAQELLQNTVKYANAKHAEVNFSIDNNDLVLAYQDDGDGFDSKTIVEGQGLKNMSTRAKLLNGEMEVLPSHNGASFKFKFPNI